MDFESGRLYVADEANNRVDVFDSEGQFLMAWGWGVANGDAEFQTCVLSCQKGISGAGKGQFNGPRAIAVDNDGASPSHHAVYVADFDNWRVQKFSPSGEFILTIGGGVNQSTGGNICTAVSGDVCGSGLKGSGDGEFSSSEFNTGIEIGVGIGGTLYASDGRSVTGEERFARLQAFASDGTFLFAKDPLATGQLEALAAAPNGAVYVRTSSPDGTFCRYKSDGEKDPSFGTGGCLIQKEEASVTAIAVDAAGHLYAGGIDPKAIGGGADYRVIAEYDSSGNPVRRFGYDDLDSAFIEGLAIYSNLGGDVYASQGEVVRQLSLPPAGPIVAPKACLASLIGNAKVRLNAEVNPEGKPTSFRFEYVDEAAYQESGFADAATVGPDPLEIEDEGEGGYFRLQLASAEVNVVPETEYRCRVVATNEDNEVGVVGSEGTFTSKPPFEILASWPSEVTSDTAILNATVNPLGIPASGYFEYVDDATYLVSGFDEAERAPLAPDELDFGAGQEAQTDSAEILNLEPGTAYHFRVIVDDPLVQPREGPERIFRTRAFGPEPAPDNRAYELVSPAQKNSAEVAVPSNAGGGAAAIRASSPDGEIATFASFTAFADPAGAPTTSQYVSRRGSAGWETENINLFGRLFNYDTPYKGFTDDYGFGAAVSFAPPLAAGCPEDFESLYWRDSDSGSLQCLSAGVPEVVAGTRFCPIFSGASSDGTRVLFAANGAYAYTGAPKGSGFSLYEWSQGSGVKLASVLPDGKPAPPKERTGFGPGFNGPTAGCKSNTLQRETVSVDGRYAFWTYDGTYKGADKPLFARTDGTKTVQLDLAEAGAAGPSGKGRFLGASRNGSAAFFSAPGKLTASAGAGGHLYRYDFGAAEGSRLEDITPGGLPADVLGFLGTSADGSSAYFVANGNLAPGASAGSCSGEGGSASGTCSLYFWRQGAGLRFIATLSGKDDAAWSSNPSRHSARTTADGRHLTFASIAELTDYDNEVEGSSGCEPNGDGVLGGDTHCAQVYIYDANAGGGTGELLCASCNPTGERPTGPSSLPAWSSPFAAPRSLSEDGSRLFFVSRDALRRADESEAQDAYEFERVGAGSCTAESFAFVATANGCLYLVSGGKSDASSYLIDASADGRDVFISTRERLLPGRDKDERYDLYDFRAGGGFPEESEDPICAGEACKPPPLAPPLAPPSTTDSFVGPGNSAAAACRKGKVRRHGRCVKKHSKKQKHKKAQSRRRQGGTTNHVRTNR